MDEKKLLGNWGEAAVADYLRKKRYKLLASQYACRFGEIDLIARSPEGVLCFVEVKTRSDARFARAREFVTYAKQQKLRSAAQMYLAQEETDAPCRFDVAEVYPEREGAARLTVNYIINAF